MDTYAQSKGNSNARGGMDTSIDKGMTTAYKNDPVESLKAELLKDQLNQALRTESDLAYAAKSKRQPRTPDSYISREQVFLIKSMVKSKDLAPSAAGSMFETFKDGKDIQASLTILTQLGGDEFSSSMEIVNAFIDKNGKPIPELKSKFVADLSGLKGKEADEFITTFQSITAMSGLGVNIDVEADYVMKNEQVRKDLFEDITAIQKTKGKITSNLLVKLDSEFTGVLAENPKFLDSLSAPDKITYSQVIRNYIAIPDTELQAEGDFLIWQAENKTKLVGVSIGRQLDMYREYMGKKGVQAKIPVFDNPKTGTTGGGGGTRSTIFDDTLKKLKQVQRSSVNAMGGKEELIKQILGKNAIEYGDGEGIDQKLLKDNKVSNEFLNFVDSLGPEGIQKDLGKIVTIGKNGIATLTKAGQALQKAFSITQFGENIKQMQLQKQEINNRIAAMKVLLKLGYDTATATKLTADAATALAIATNKINVNILKEYLAGTKELNKVVDNATIVQEVAQKTGIEGDIARNENLAKRVKAQEALIDGQYLLKKVSLDIQKSENDYGLDLIARKEDKINSVYDEQIKALQEVNSLAEKNNELTSAKMSIADALASGDMAAASNAMQAYRTAKIQQVAKTKEEALQKAKENAIKSVTVTNSKTGKVSTRKDLEESNKDVSNQLADIDELNRLAKLKYSDTMKAMVGQTTAQITAFADIAQLFVDAYGPKAASEMAGGIFDTVDGKLNAIDGVTSKVISNTENLLELFEKARTDAGLLGFLGTDLRKEQDAMLDANAKAIDAYAKALGLYFAGLGEAPKKPKLFDLKLGKKQKPDKKEKTTTSPGGTAGSGGSGGSGGTAGSTGVNASEGYLGVPGLNITVATPVAEIAKITTAMADHQTKLSDIQIGKDEARIKELQLLIANSEATRNKITIAMADHQTKVTNENKMTAADALASVKAAEAHAKTNADAGEKMSLRVAEITSAISNAMTALGQDRLARVKQEEARVAAEKLAAEQAVIAAGQEALRLAKQKEAEDAANKILSGNRDAASADKKSLTVPQAIAVVREQALAADRIAADKIIADKKALDDRDAQIADKKSLTVPQAIALAREQAFAQDRLQAKAIQAQMAADAAAAAERLAAIEAGRLADHKGTKKVVADKKLTALDARDEAAAKRAADAAAALAAQKLAAESAKAEEIKAADQKEKAKSNAEYPSSIANAIATFGRIYGFASGGKINGPGTSTSDSIPALLSNGEYVINAGSVSKYGVDLFESLNAQKLADGGYLGVKGLQPDGKFKEKSVGQKVLGTAGTATGAVGNFLKEVLQMGATSFIRPVMQNAIGGANAIPGMGPKLNVSDIDVLGANLYKKDYAAKDVVSDALGIGLTFANPFKYLNLIPGVSTALSAIARPFKAVGSKIAAPFESASTKNKTSKETTDLISRYVAPGGNRFISPEEVLEITKAAGGKDLGLSTTLFRGTKTDLSYLKPGDIYDRTKYMSTSLSERAANNFTYTDRGVPSLITIITNPKTKGLDVNNLGFTNDLALEREILLGAGKFKVLANEMVTDDNRLLNKVTMEAIAPKKISDRLKKLFEPKNTVYAATRGMKLPPVAKKTQAEIDKIDLAKIAKENEGMRQEFSREWELAQIAKKEAAMAPGTTDWAAISASLPKVAKKAGKKPAAEIDKKPKKNKTTKPSYYLYQGADDDISLYHNIFSAGAKSEEGTIKGVAAILHDPFDGSLLETIGNKGSITESFDLMALALMDAARMSGTTKTGLNAGIVSSRTDYSQKLVDTLKARGLDKIVDIHPRIKPSFVDETGKKTPPGSKVGGQVWLENELRFLNNESNRYDVLKSSTPIPDSVVKIAKQTLLDLLKYGFDKKQIDDAVKQYGKGMNIPGYAMGGIVAKYMADGGMASGTDTVPAMLTPGEFVVNRKATQTFGPLLSAINSPTFKTPTSSNPNFSGTNSSNSITSTNNSKTLYNYNLSVNVSNSNANPNDIARTVINQIKMIEDQRIRRY